MRSRTPLALIACNWPLDVFVVPNPHALPTHNLRGFNTADHLDVKVNSSLHHLTFFLKRQHC